MEALSTSFVCCDFQGNLVNYLTVGTVRRICNSCVNSKICSDQRRAALGRHYRFMRFYYQP